MPSAEGAAQKSARSRSRSRAKAEAARAPDALTRQLASTAGQAVVMVGASRCVDFGGLALKRDHSRRPFWVTPTGRVFLEAWSPLYAQARDFLIAVCEPVSRPDLVHEYRLDKNALFAAASMGMTADLILAALNRMSKVPVHERVADFVRDWTGGYGKVKLVLKRGRFFVESAFPGVLRVLNKHPTVRAARVRYLADGTRLVGLDRPGDVETAASAAAAATAAAAHSAAEGRADPHTPHAWRAARSFVAVHTPHAHAPAAPRTKLIGHLLKIPAPCGSLPFLHHG